MSDPTTAAPYLRPLAARPIQVYETAGSIVRMIQTEAMQSGWSEAEYSSEVLDEVVGLLALAGCRSAQAYEDCRAKRFAEDLAIAEAVAHAPDRPAAVTPAPTPEGRRRRVVEICIEIRGGES